MTETQPREVVAEDFAAVNAASFSGDEWQARVDLAAMYRLAAHFNYDDTVWNHITMRVPGSDHDFFLNKFGLLYNEVTASNIIKVDSDGNVLEGPADVNTAGFVIHSAIHNDFPQWKVVFHAHVPDALAVTALADGFQHIVQDTSMLYGEIGSHDWEGLSLTLEERERLAKKRPGKPSWSCTTSFAGAGPCWPPPQRGVKSIPAPRRSGSCPSASTTTFPWARTNGRPCAACWIRTTRPTANRLPSWRQQLRGASGEPASPAEQ